VIYTTNDRVAEHVAAQNHQCAGRSQRRGGHEAVVSGLGMPRKNGPCGAELSGALNRFSILCRNGCPPWTRLIHAAGKPKERSIVDIWGAAPSPGIYRIRQDCWLSAERACARPRRIRPLSRRSGRVPAEPTLRSGATSERKPSTNRKPLHKTLDTAEHGPSVSGARSSTSKSEYALPETAAQGVHGKAPAGFP